MAEMSARGVYVISVAAELAGMHPQTLRIYERRGLLDPARTGGGSRRYSEHDIARLRRIHELTEAGMNLAGVKAVMELEEEVIRLRRELAKAVQESRDDGRAHPPPVPPRPGARPPGAGPLPRTPLTVGRDRAVCTGGHGGDRPGSSRGSATTSGACRRPAPTTTWARSSTTSWGGCRCSPRRPRVRPTRAIPTATVGDRIRSGSSGRAADRLIAGWSDHGLDRQVRLSGGELPGPMAFNMTVMEYMGHGWDLATATGQAYPLDRRPGHRRPGPGSGDAAAAVPGRRYAVRPRGRRRR